MSAHCSRGHTAAGRSAALRSSRSRSRGGPTSTIVQAARAVRMRRASRADEKARRVLDRVHGGGEADAQAAAAARTSAIEPRERRAPGGCRACRASSACSSSTMTVRTLRSSARAALGGEHQVQRLRRRDEDVRRRREDRRARRPASCRRCAAPVRISGGVDAHLAARLRRSRRAALPGCAGCRCSAPSAARRRRRRCWSGSVAGESALRTARSMLERNAASVLPEPVGAATSASRPSTMRCQPRSCASVGASKRRSNQVRMTGWKDSGSTALRPLQ